MSGEIHFRSMQICSSSDETTEFFNINRIKVDGMHVTDNESSSSIIKKKKVRQFFSSRFLSLDACHSLLHSFN